MHLKDRVHELAAYMNRDQYTHRCFPQGQMQILLKVKGRDIHKVGITRKAESLCKRCQSIDSDQDDW